MNQGNQKITTFFMFDGKAEEAMRFYTSLFANSEIKSLIHYDQNGPGKEGSVMHAVFTLNGVDYMAIDSAVKHEFTFTPSTSLYIRCETESEIDRLFAELSKDGAVFMKLGDYGFSKKFGWLLDRFGLSWQLTLE